MNLIFPLIYSTIIFIVLLILTIYLFGQIQLTQKVEKRIENLQKQIQVNSINYENNYKLGQIFLRKKLYDQAILYFQQALKGWNSQDKLGLGSLYNTLGFTYFTLKNYFFAIYYYKCAINLLPDYFLALNNLSFTYEKVQNYDKALNFYLLAKLNKKKKIINSRIFYLNKKRNLKF